MHTSVHTHANTHAHYCLFISIHSYIHAHWYHPAHTHSHSVPDPWPDAPVHTYMSAAHTSLHRFKHTNSHILNSSRPSAPNPRFSHRGSLIMGSRQTCETSSCCAIISGKKLGVGKRLLNLEGLILRGDSEEEGKKESSTEVGKPSSEQGITGISRDHLTAFINPRVYFFPLLLDKFMETDSHSRRRQLHPAKQSSL